MTRQEMLVTIRNALVVMKRQADWLDNTAKEMQDDAKHIRLRGKELQDVWYELKEPDKWDKQ